MSRYEIMFARSARRAEARFIHGICPECRERLRAEMRGGAGG